MDFAAFACSFFETIGVPNCSEKAHHLLVNVPAPKELFKLTNKGRGLPI